MSTSPYFNKENQAIWEAVDNYFTNAGSSSEENARLIRPAYGRWKGAVVFAGFSWVAERLETEGVETGKLQQYGMPVALATHRIKQVGEEKYSQLKDLVMGAYGADAGSHLLASVTIPGDEDEIALAAYMLAQNFVSTIEPLPLEAGKFVLASLLKDGFVGTSCRMAISWLLYTLGDTKPWESMVYENYFVQSDFVHVLETTVKQVMPELKKQDVKELLCREYAVPGSTNLPTTLILDKMGIFEFLVLDIATNGRVFKVYPNWTRKPKN